MRFVHLKLVGPAVALIALVIVGLAAIPYFGVARLDAEARDRQEKLVERNISLWINDVEFSLTAWTIWDEAIAKLDNSFDPDWTERNIGASLIGTSRTRFTAVLDRSDAILYAKTDDTVKDRPFFVRGAQVIVGDTLSLVEKVRTKEHQPDAKGIPQPIVFSRIEVMGNEAVLLSASLFQPDFGTVRLKGERAPILVTAMPIGGSLQEFFGNRFFLDDPRLGPVSTVAPDRARSEIAVGTDGEIEVLSWRPPTPASDLLHQTLPLIVIVTLVLIVGGALVVRTSQRTAAVLLGDERRMRHAATHDFLTGLANRSLLEPAFAEQASLGSLNIICLDLDGFKRVNDTHGHAMGDELLKAVAGRLSSAIRNGDRLFRLGGDEFAIMMAQISPEEAEQRCRLLSLALSTPFALLGSEISIGASFGVAAVSGTETTCDTALKTADAALYDAKSRGRGAVVSATSVVGVGPRRMQRA